MVSPHLGKGTLFRSLDKILPIPQHYHASFARWHQLAMLKTPEHLRELARLERASLSPEPIGHFIEVIRNDWGFNIYRVVADAKARLSSARARSSASRLGDLEISREITRADFEDWIDKDIARIAQTVDALLTDNRVAADAIDSVFLTGGSSLIPAVRRVFADRFGAQRLADGENFQSVAHQPRADRPGRRSRSMARPRRVRPAGAGSIEVEPTILSPWPSGGHLSCSYSWTPGSSPGGEKRVLSLSLCDRAQGCLIASI